MQLCKHEEGKEESNCLIVEETNSFLEGILEEEEELLKQCELLQKEAEEWLQTDFLKQDEPGRRRMEDVSLSQKEISMGLVPVTEDRAPKIILKNQGQDKLDYADLLAPGQEVEAGVAVVNVRKQQKGVEKLDMSADVNHLNKMIDDPKLVTWSGAEVQKVEAVRYAPEGEPEAEILPNADEETQCAETVAPRKLKPNEFSKTSKDAPGRNVQEELEFAKAKNGCDGIIIESPKFTAISLKRITAILLEVQRSKLPPVDAEGKDTVLQEIMKRYSFEANKLFYKEKYQALGGSTWEIIIKEVMEFLERGEPIAEKFEGSYHSQIKEDIYVMANLQPPYGIWAEITVQDRNLGADYGQRKDPGTARLAEMAMNQMLGQIYYFKNPLTSLAIGDLQEIWNHTGLKISRIYWGYEALSERSQSMCLEIFQSMPEARTNKSIHEGATEMKRALISEDLKLIHEGALRICLAQMELLQSIFAMKHLQTAQKYSNRTLADAFNAGNKTLMHGMREVLAVLKIVGTIAHIRPRLKMPRLKTPCREKEQTHIHVATNFDDAAYMGN